MSKNGIKMTIKMLLIVMTPTFWYNRWIIIKCYRGENFKKCKMTPLQLSIKELNPDIEYKS